MLLVMTVYSCWTSLTLDPRSILEPLGKLHPSLSNKNDPYALVIRRIFGEKIELKSTTLQINSPHILKAFRDVVKSYPTVASDFTKPFELLSPFQKLMHYWDQLDQYRQCRYQRYLCAAASAPLA